MKQIAHIQLSELAYAVEQGIKKSVAGDFWIVAEISECSINSKGHCYIEFIEKPEHSDTIIAKMRATIWAYNFRLISVYFKSSTGIDIQAGLKVLVKVTVEYHVLYGISLNVTDIDPVYTIGEDERQRREIIQRLSNEGIATMNKELEMPLVPQRIAIISSATAAGYQDFMHQLTHNQYNLVFHTTLFATAMQGIEVEESMITSLDAIYACEQNFDAVVIIRGGGAKTDLRWFDNYKIAANVAQFPLPIIAGIGHDKDQSILDLVAHTSLKTPTAVAEYLISCGSNVLYELDEFTQRLENAWNEVLQNQKELLQSATKQIQHVFKTSVLIANAELQKKAQNLINQAELTIEKEQAKLRNSQKSLAYTSNFIIHSNKNNVQLVANNLRIAIKQKVQQQAQTLLLHETKLNLHNPQTILKKGFSITTNVQGKLIQSTSDVQKGEILCTRLSNGSITSTVN
jgi:exodeoxyribonuclease VII large subunit